MPKYAYLDMNRNVVGLADSDVSLVIAQAKNPAITQKIDNVPDELLFLGSNGTYHQLINGQAGTDIAHYLLLDHIDHLKPVRITAVDVRTFDLIGATPLTHNARQFVMHDGAKMLWGLLHSQKAIAVFPQPFPAVGPSYDFANEADVDAFSTAFYAHTWGFVQSGEALKNAIISATTKAELDAVVDAR